MPQLSLHTPIGPMTVSEEDGEVVAVDWGWGRDQTETKTLRQARAELHEYFDGKRTTFTVTLNPGGTAYRRRVWEALRCIPYGVTCSYADIARVAGGAARSVGQASASNPIPIIIPCHRVLASNGIGGYSGEGGLDTKRYLLALEHQAGPGPAA